ncbi:MAG: DUF2959 domain-containing protein [Xanthomonadales bacterium]|nr:DUF2959 domain-containing protein [Xanthomonadales bacterium]
MNRVSPLRVIILLLAAGAMTGCASAYYGTMESFGVHKRELLVDRVDKALETQEEAKEQFADALERFSAVTEFDGGDLEDLYDDLKDELDDSEEKAEEVAGRVESVRDVAEALFDEWEDELDQYSDGKLRRQSEQSLKETRRRYARLIRAMESAEARIDPVLDTFRDQVLYLKHNLNARAVASLRTQLGGIEQDVQALINAMNDSIAEARTFIEQMET